MRTNISPLYLTKSKTRTDLLTLFFLNPERSYYLRELERRFGYSPGLLARELKILAGENILDRNARGREVFYQINKTHPLFHEIKGIIEKTAGVPKRLSDGLKKIKEIKQAYLYGSFAQGRMAVQSDIDLLLVGQETELLRKLFGRLEARFGRTINAAVYSEEEFEKKKKNKSEFIYEVMKSSLIQVKP
jgi:predicted nucleotidyltransferase